MTDSDKIKANWRSFDQSDADDLADKIHDINTDINNAMRAIERIGVADGMRFSLTNILHIASTIREAIEEGQFINWNLREAEDAGFDMPSIGWERYKALRKYAEANPDARDRPYPAYCDLEGAIPNPAMAGFKVQTVLNGGAE